jgi:hypothetical protein
MDLKMVTPKYKHREIVSVIKDYLCQVSEAEGRSLKAEKATELIQFLRVNKEWVWMHPKFYCTALTKLCAFIEGESKRNPSFGTFCSLSLEELYFNNCVSPTVVAKVDPELVARMKRAQAILPLCKES